MGESKDTRALCKFISQPPHNAECYPLIASEWTPLGWPDRLIVTDQWCALVEFKRKGGKLTKDQVARCKRILSQRTQAVVGCEVTPHSVRIFDTLGRYDESDEVQWKFFIDYVRLYLERYDCCFLSERQKSLRVNFNG